MARLRTGKVGGSSPYLAVGHDILIVFVHDTHAEEPMIGLTEDGRLRILDHTLLSEDILPSLITCQVIEEGSSHLTEVMASHLHTTDILQVIELQVLLL